MEQVKREISDPKRELLSSIGLFIGTGLLGFWFEVGAALGTKMGPTGGPGSLRDPMVNSIEELISI